MTEKDLSIGSEVGPPYFHINVESIKDQEKQPFIMCYLFMSELNAKIQLVSQIIDVTNVALSYIQNDRIVREHTIIMTKSESVVEKLLNYSDGSQFCFTSKPLLPAHKFFTCYNNSYDVIFKDCDDFAVGEVYDKLIYSMSKICDLVVSNIILANIMELIYNANSIFSSAKLNRLLGFRSPVFEEQSVIDLFDICSIKGWNVSSQDAQSIFDSLRKQINMLVVPSSAIEILTADLTERKKYIIENRGLKTYKTLEELGTELGLTRERIRQISSKVVRSFRASLYKLKLIEAVFFTLKVLCECDCCFTVNELSKFNVSENALTFLSEVMCNKYKLVHLSETDYIVLFDKDGKCRWLELITASTDSYHMSFIRLRNQLVAGSRLMIQIN